MSVNKTSLLSRLKRVLRKENIVEKTWEDLESVLVEADFGYDFVEILLEHAKTVVTEQNITDAADIVPIIKEKLVKQLSEYESALNLSGSLPAIILVVGVNGVGKTTTIGKLGAYISGFQKKTLFAAADTFRAAAVEQLSVWAHRAGCDIVSPDQPNQDPASVAYKATEKAIRESYDVLIVDTAGRLQTKLGLMDELSKIKKVVEKQHSISEVLLVLDATTGQNGVQQAKAFIEQAGVTGLVISKLDGSAKGGFIFRVQQETGIPVKLIGQGEGVNDLSGFSAEGFVGQLFS